MIPLGRHGYLRIYPLHFYNRHLIKKGQVKCSKRYKFYGTGRDQGHPFQQYAPIPWGISRPGVSSWVSTRVKNGNLVWCNEDGNEWSDDKEMNKALRSGKGYVKINDSYTSVDTIGLPTPFVLTGDPRWDVGGEFYQMYDLELECDDAGDNKDMDGDKNSDDSLNTPKDSYGVDNIKNNGNSGKGVKVLSKK